MWLAEIEKGDSSIEEPSEWIIARLRQLRERSVNSRTTRGMQHREIVDQLEQQTTALTQQSDASQQLSSIATSLTQILAARTAAEEAQMERERARRTPLNCEHPDWLLVRAFFQYWYDFDGYKDPYSQYVVLIAQKVAINKQLTLSQIRNPQKISSFRWAEIWRFPINALSRMRHMVSRFIDDDSWETWVGLPTGWDLATFEREEYEYLAAHTLDLMGMSDLED
jgi:hypothetical protein